MPTTDPVMMSKFGGRIIDVEKLREDQRWRLQYGKTRDPRFKAKRGQWILEFEPRFGGGCHQVALFVLVTLDSANRISDVATAACQIFYESTAEEIDVPLFGHDHEVATAEIAALLSAEAVEDVQRDARLRTSTPVVVEQLIALLSTSVFAGHAAKLVETLQLTRAMHPFENSETFSNSSQRIEMVANAVGAVTTVFLTPGEQDLWKEGVPAAMTRETVHRLLGRPTHSSGPDHWWDRFDSQGVSIHVQYGGRPSVVSRITIMAPEVAPGFKREASE